MSNGNGNNGGRLYSFASTPVLIDCNFVVDATNGNGNGIRNLKGQGVKNVYMATSASFTGTYNNAVTVTGIAGGTASLLVGMPVSGTGIPAGATIASIVSSSSVTLSAATTGGATTGAISYVGVHNPLLNTNVATTSKGLAWIQLRSNYNRYLGGFSGFASPTTGSTKTIDATDAALTVGSPYIIATVGVGPKGAATIAPVADSSGSLASCYFMLYDSYGNSFALYFIVNGAGSAPNLGPALNPSQLASGARGLTYVPIVIATNATAGTIGTALVTAIAALPSGINGTFSFTATGTTTVTVTSTLNAPLSGIPQDGSATIPVGNGTPGVPQSIWFTITSGSATAGSVWTDGSGNLYTVSTTLSSGTTLKTSGYQAPSPAAGTLTFVSGTGASTALTYSAAVSGLATGFTFAQTVSDTNLQDWQGVGLPSGMIPTVGQAFVAKATGSGGSTGTVIAPGVSGIESIEVIGDPNQTFSPSPQGGSAHPGAWILVQFLSATNSSTTTMIPTAPANNTVVGMSFYVDQRFSPSNVNSTVTATSGG